MSETDGFTWLRLLLAFGVVATLLLGLAYILKYVTKRGLIMPQFMMSSDKRRMQVVESLPLDMRRRLVIVRVDSTEHLLLLGHERDIVVSSNLPDPFGINTKAVS